MATGAQAIERIAEATGIPAVTVDTASRVLKQHIPPLWPLAGRGGGKRAKHVEAAHLVNLVLALAAADPITSAPVVVARLRRMAERQPSIETWFHELGPGVSAYTVNETPINKLAMGLLGGSILALGDVLDMHVQAVGLEPRYRAFNAERNFEVRLSAWPREYAAISWTKDNGAVGTRTFDGLGLLADLSPEAPAASLQRSVAIPGALFEVLADLWRDTHDRRMPTPSLPLSDPAPTTAGPETENAGSTTEPASNLGRDSKAPAFLAEHPEAREGREKSQAPSRSPGRSLNRHRSRHDGRHDSADRACA